MRLGIVLLLMAVAWGQTCIPHGDFDNPSKLTVDCEWFNWNDGYLVHYAVGKHGAPVLLAQLPDRIVSQRHLVACRYCDLEKWQKIEEEAEREAEPVDIPAIQETRNTKCVGATVCMESGCSCASALVEELHWTCADKSRILLTSEDGAHHCIKLQGAR